MTNIASRALLRIGEGTIE